MHPEDFLSLEEWHTLMKATQSAREAALLWLLGGTGLHVSEAAKLNVEHLDKARGLPAYCKWQVGKQRTSVLPKPVLEALQGHLGGRDVGYIFEGRD
jgi:integrase